MNLWECLHFLHRAWRYRLRAESDEIGYLLRRELRGQTVVDIGANRGIYSYWMHRAVGPEGRVVAFEPQPELAADLEQLKRVFRLRRLQIANVGLSAAPGMWTLVRPRKNWGGASLELMASDDTDSFEVKLTTLDAFFHGHPGRPVRFIKCDVEGHELQVFRGGMQLLREDRPELLFECFDQKLESGEIIELLAELGYEGHFFFKRKLLPFDRYPSLRQAIDRPYLNFVFTPREARDSHDG